MADFFQAYFVDPIYYNTGYNLVNTSVFALILIAAALLTYKMLKRMKISIDSSFFKGIVPFIALGGILRAYEDMLEATGVTHSLAGGFLKNFILTDAFGVARNLLLISPFIYVSIFLLTLVLLIVSKLLENKTKYSYWKTWFAFGAVIDLAILSQMRFLSTFAFVSVILITAAWFLALIAAQKAAVKYKLGVMEKLLTKENIFLIGVHMFEATTTYVALQFPKQIGINYFEQHVVSGFFISVLGPASFFLLKLAVVPLVLYYFDKEFAGTSATEMEKKTFLKIVVLILGLGPGLRNFLRTVMGV